MNKTLYIIVLLLSLVGCKPTASVIVTSKEEAKSKGLYTEPQNTATLPKNNLKSTSKGIVETKKQESTKSKKTKISEPEDDYEPDNDGTSYFVKQLIHTALQYDGVRYRGGGTTPAGMDCSGLVFTVFKEFDITLPRSSNDMAKVGNKLKTSEIKKGDLVFFRTNGRKVINHVGLVTEVKDDEILFIHSSVQRGVIISSTKEPYYQRTFAQANRILSNELM